MAARGVVPGHTCDEVILSLDAEKLFDRVEWGYLLETLKLFQFGPKVIITNGEVDTVYTSPMASVHTNCNISSYFESQCSMRQGCPLSPLLLVLVIEQLAISFWQKPVIKV